MGGALTIAVATVDPRVQALAPFYGVPDLSFWDVSKVNGPVFSNFAELDTMAGFSSPDDAKKLETALKDAGKTVTTV